METISSSFLQKYTLVHSLTPSPPLQLRFKISSILTNEKPSSSPARGAVLINPTKPEFFLPQKKESQELKTEQSLISKIFNSLDDFICNSIDPPLHLSIDPNHVLSGNFAPVGELPPTPCVVEEGALPPCLNGAYIRNGPNPQFFPRGPYHLFDGDGMLHSIKISDGKATFCSRFIKTYKYRVERESGSPVMLNFFSAFNGLAASIARCAVTFGRVKFGQYDPGNGIGNVNTSLALIGGELFALGESDLPYRLKLTPDGDIVTLGRHDSFGKPFTTMTAHPKIDAETLETFAFRQSITFKAPFLTYFKINRDGEKQIEVPINSVTEAILVHDFAVTKIYAIFPDSQMVMKLENILKGTPAVCVDPEKVSRLGIIPREAVDGDEMTWIRVPDFNLMHVVNAWDEDGGNTVVMVAANVVNVKYLFNRMDLAISALERLEINVKEKKVKRRVLSPANLDFGVINPALAGKKNRYIYAAIGSPMPKISGVAKIDLSLSTFTSVTDCMVASRLYGPHCYGGEAIFVPRASLNPAAEEDDGYLVTYVHNEITLESKFIVMDAKSPTLEIVAKVKLPARVPYGFHGIFVPQKCISDFDLNLS